MMKMDRASWALRVICTSSLVSEGLFFLLYLLSLLIYSLHRPDDDTAVTKAVHRATGSA
jgi:hypothetical protein